MAWSKWGPLARCLRLRAVTRPQWLEEWLEEWKHSLLGLPPLKNIYIVVFG